MTATIIIGLLIPLLGTMLGSAFVFIMKDEMSARLQKTLLGFASGVMVAASVWSLLIPAMEMKAESGVWSVVPAAIGFLLGIGFLLLIDEFTPHLHIGTDKPEGIKSHMSKTAMLALAVTIHNLPEGMAVGVVFAGAENGASHISLAAAISVSLGIAIQNIPEGVEGLTVASKTHSNDAVKGVSFNVREGEIVCIAGIDGNGQTELVYGLTGLEPLSGGKITMCGQDITNLSIRKKSLLGMSLSSFSKRNE